MKTHIENSSRLDILGNWPSDQDIFTTTLKHWQRKLGYYSIFATVPALLATHVPVAHSDEGKRPEASVVGQGVRFRETPNMSRSNPVLLKRQSEFLLPHQQGNFALLAPLAGNDDCPGRTIPGGNYTAAAPYIDTGDTTGANNTVTRLFYYYYFDVNIPGPDHIYTFTLTGRGANPQIKISASSSTYRPAVYILDGGRNTCPAGTENTVFEWVQDHSAGPGGSITIDMNSLPLNVPLHLFVDSEGGNDTSGSGPYVLRMQDVTIFPAVADTNSIDVPEFFVRQHYLDFLAREPEQSGMEAWLRVLRDCPAGDNQCLHQARLTTSAAFFGSPEFQLKGYFVFRFYKVAFARLPTYDEISSDMQSVSRLTPAEVYAAKAAFTDAFVQRQEFVNTFSGLSNADYVAALMGRYGLSTVTAPDLALPDDAVKVTLTSAELVDRLNGGSLTRAQVLRAVADSDQVFHLEFNPAFVAMQYYGYLRRTPEVTGYNDWLNYLNAHPEDFREMVRGFVDSIEYRSRFGQP